MYLASSWKSNAVYFYCEYIYLNIFVKVLFNIFKQILLGSEDNEVAIQTIMLIL